MLTMLKNMVTTLKSLPPVLIKQERIVDHEGDSTGVQIAESFCQDVEAVDVCDELSVELFLAFLSYFLSQMACQ